MSAIDRRAVSLERTAILLLNEGRTPAAVRADAEEMAREGFLPSAGYRRLLASVMEAVELRRRFQ